MPVVTQDHMKIHLSPELGYLRAHEEAVDKVIASNLGKHMVKGFGVLPLDQEAHPFQRMDCVRVTSEGASADELLGLAGFVYPKIDRLVDYIMDKKADQLDSIVDIFEKERLLTLLSNHLDIDGVAIAGGSFLVALEKSGRINAKDLNTELFVSAMIKRTTLYDRPTVALITQAFPTLRFSIPSTNEKNRQIPSDIRDPFNTTSTADIDDYPSDKPVFRLAASSGTSDRKSGRRFGKKSKRSPTIHMGPMSDGTKSLAERGKILGYGLDTGNAEPEFYIGEVIDPTAQEFGAHTVMIDVAAGMSANSRFRRQYHLTRESFEAAAPKKRKSSKLKIPERLRLLGWWRWYA